MRDFNKMQSRLDLAKRVVIFSGSIAISLWIVIRLVAMGMFGSQIDLTWQDFWIESVLWAFGGGCVSGLLWGGSSLRNIFWLAVPGGMWIGLILIQLPFLIFDPSEAGIAHDLLGYLSVLTLFACIACVPLLGPVMSHAIWNQRSWSEMQEEIRKRWKEFRNTFSNESRWTDGPRGPFTIPLFDRLPHAVRAIIVFILLGLVFSLFNY